MIVGGAMPLPYNLFGVTTNVPHSQRKGKKKAGAAWPSRQISLGLIFQHPVKQLHILARRNSPAEVLDHIPVLQPAEAFPVAMV